MTLMPNGVEVKVPAWAIFVTIDGDGDVTAWSKKPSFNEVYSQWYTRFATRQVIYQFKEKVNSASEQIFQTGKQEHEKQKSE